MITMILGKPGSGKSLYKTWLLHRFCEARCMVASNVELTTEFPFFERVLRLDDHEGKYPVFDVSSEDREGYLPFVGRKGKPLFYRAFWHFLTPYYELDGTPIPPPRRGPVGPMSWKIVVDEYDNFFDALDFAEIPEAVRLYHKQHRKYQHDLFIGVQDLDNLYNRIRRMAQLYIICENMGRTERIYQWLPFFKPKFLHSEYSSPDGLPRSHMGDGHFSMAEAEVLFGWYRTDQIASGLSYTGGGIGKREALGYEEV